MPIEFNNLVMGNLIIEVTVPPAYVTNGLQAYLDAGSVASYPGSGTTWFDISGNNNNLTLVNSPTYVSGPNGYFSFNGTTQYGSGSVTNTTDWTVQMFVYTNNKTGALVYYPFSPAGAQGLGYGGTFLQPQGNVIYYAGPSGVVQANVQVDVGAWASIATTKSGSSHTIYKNATSLNTGSVGSQSLSTYNIGRRADNIWYFNGRISIVLIYNRQLSASEIAQNYTAFSTRY